MKRNTIMSEVELSCEELKCLEAHFRQMQNDAVIHSLRQTPAVTAHLLEKILTMFSSVDQLKPTKAKP